MSTEVETTDRVKWSPWAIAAAVLLLLMFGVIAVGTLRGCFFVDPVEVAKKEEERKKKEEEEKKQREFKIAPPIVQPAEMESVLSFVKPGHWATATQLLQYNLRDFVGDTHITVTNDKDAVYPVPNTPFVVGTSQPVLLAKARPKLIESTFFVPPTAQSLRIASQLEERGIGFPLNKQTTMPTRMPSYQYHFVVLAKQPSRYGFLKSLDSVRVPWDGETDADDTEDPLHYRVVQIDATKSIPLSDNALTWTSIAYMLWDEVDPGDPLSAEQKRALLDWLHWGGQLVINGPNSLDLLKGSFLEPYLPATSGGPRKIAADDPAIAELNDEKEGWLVTPAAKGGEPLRVTAWSGVSLNVYKDKSDRRSDGRALPKTGGLFVSGKLAGVESSSPRCSFHSETW